MITATEYEIEEDSGGIFNWKRDRRIWLHLSAFLLVSIIFHGSGFYLFKVVYPSPERVETNSGAITFLNPSDPGARAVLQRIEDRTVFLLPPSSRSDVRVSLDQSEVRFIPAFNRTELELKPIPESDVVWTELGESPVSRELNGNIRLEMAPSLSRRVVAPWSTTLDYFSMVGAFPPVRAEVVVSPDGGVEVVEIESELIESETDSLDEVIASTLRFFPSKSTDRGWIELKYGGG